MECDGAVTGRSGAGGEGKTQKLAGNQAPSFWRVERLSQTDWRCSQPGLSRWEDWGAVSISFLTHEIEGRVSLLSAHQGLPQGAMQDVSGDVLENMPGSPDFDPDNPYVIYGANRMAALPQGLGEISFRLEIKRDRIDEPAFFALREHIHRAFYEAECEAGRLFPSYGQNVDGAPHLLAVDTDEDSAGTALPQALESMADREINRIGRMHMPVIWLIL